MAQKQLKAMLSVVLWRISLISTQVGKLKELRIFLEIFEDDKRIAWVRS